MGAVLLLGLLAALPAFYGCGGGSASTATSTAATSTPDTTFDAVYKKTVWGAAATVTYPASCTMTLTTTGVPPQHDDYYLAPVSTAYPTTVAVTPVSKTAMALTPYLPSSIVPNTVTINTCPAKAAATTATNMGVIGYTLSGEALFNAYEAGGTISALSDNVSYTFKNAAGASVTASFIDACNSHPTPISGGYTWHYHAVPVCLTSTLDTTGGPSHLLGIALDGYPVYGGRDMSGNVITVAQLDACNGITSATPEFPKGAYHYVLPIGVTGAQSSLGCYAGTVSKTVVAAAEKKACRMPKMAMALPKRGAMKMTM
jgi:hypothetical protein